jgi:RNA polymerase sigma-70 factor (ECF subfamily)
MGPMRPRRIEKLFERYRDQADGAALAAVFDATAPRLLELACHLVRDPSEAEDLVQSTFLAAIRHAQRFDSSAPLEGWLYGILWREALKAKRRAARRVDPRDVDQPAESDPGEVLAAAELPQAVREALETLPRHERDVLEPFLLEDLRADEIARKLKRSAGTVRSQIHRALGRLRRNLPASLTPVAGMIPIRGLDVVRTHVLAAAGVPPGTVAAVVGGGVASRVGIVVATLVIASGGWLAVRLVQRSSTDEPKTAVRLESEDGATSSRQPVVVPPTSERAPVPAGGARLALTVVNWPMAHPAAGLRVEIWPRVPGKSVADSPSSVPDQKPVAEGVLDARGELELDVPVRQPLRIALPEQGDARDISGDPAPFGGKPFDLDGIEPGERKALRIQVLFGREFNSYGRVVSDEDGQPIAGARVLSIGSDPAGDAASEFATGAGNHARWLEAGADGMFELKLTYEQQFLAKLAILAPGRSPMLTRDRGGSSRESPSVFRLLRNASLHGRMFDDTAQSNAPFTVRLSARCYELSSGEGRADWISESPGVSWETECDRDGRFDFAELPARARLDVRVLRGDKQVLWINGHSLDAPILDPGESRELELRVRTGAKVTGVAFDKNLAPVPKHGIWLLRMVIDTIYNPGPVGVLISGDNEMVVARTQSDEQGRFKFENVEPGTWWVGLEPPPGNQSPAPTDPVIPLAVQFEVPKAVPSVEVNIKPKNTLPIRGRVLKPDGSPSPDTSIALAKENDFGPQSGVSGPDGSFSVVPVDAGPWKLCAHGSWTCVDSDPVEAQAGQDGVILRLKVAASISGEVACADCGEDRLLEVSILGEQIEYWAHGTAFQHGQRFEFSGLRAGTYHVLAQCEPDRVAFVRDIKVDAGAVISNVHVELTTGAVLVLRYTGNRETYNFGLWLGDVTAGSKDVPKGTTRRIIVPPGVVKLRPDAGGTERVLTVRAGTETEVVLDDT